MSRTLTVEDRALAPAPHKTDVSFGRFGQHTALLVDGVVQSIAFGASIQHTSLYWPLMLPMVQPRRALLLGIGGGTLANLLLERWPHLHLTGVDDDQDVVCAAAQAGWLPPRLHVRIADAFGYLRSTEAHFDYIAVDLFRGAQIAINTFDRGFLRNLRRHLTPRGSVAFNLFADTQLAERLERLQQCFTIDRIASVGINVVVHCS